MKQIQLRVFVKVEKTLIQYNLKWNLLRCDKNDSGENMCGAGGKKALLNKFTTFMKI